MPVPGSTTSSYSAGPSRVRGPDGCGGVTARSPWRRHLCVVRPLPWRRCWEGCGGPSSRRSFAARSRAVLGVDVRAIAAKCPVPVLYLAASHDIVVSQWNAKAVKTAVPRAEVVTIRGPHLALRTNAAAQRCGAEHCRSRQITADHATQFATASSVGWGASLWTGRPARAENPVAVPAARQRG